MKNVVILGAGTAGTIVANRLSKRLPDGWRVTLIEPEAGHLYQPGLLFLPFGARDERKMIRPRKRTLFGSVRWIEKRAEKIDPDRRQVLLEDERVDYDLLVIATGARIAPDETPGLVSPEWCRTAHDFYTLEGAQALRGALANFDGGRLVLNIVEMPIKCPIAPLEFVFLADDYFKKRGMRNDVEIVLATPLDGAFTRPIASRMLGSLLDEKQIKVESEFSCGEVDAAGKKIVSYDEREIPYDLLVSIPTHMGAPLVESSGLGDELAFVPTDRKTLRARAHDDIFVIGDATDLPTSKAGSVAHFQSEILVENVERTIRGASLVETFDGHANCFIETGAGKGLLIDFNYDVEPLPGEFPLPVVGPFALLKETRVNHWGKLAFRWVYWNLMLQGRPLPVPTRMSMTGKRALAAEAA